MPNITCHTYLLSPTMSFWYPVCESLSFSVSLSFFTGSFKILKQCTLDKDKIHTFIPGRPGFACTNTSQTCHQIRTPKFSHYHVNTAFCLSHFFIICTHLQQANLNDHLSRLTSEAMSSDCLIFTPITISDERSIYRRCLKYIFNIYILMAALCVELDIYRCSFVNPSQKSILFTSILKGFSQFKTILNMLII